MRLPKTLNDRGLFEDEPFLNELAKRSAMQPRRKDTSWSERMIDQIMQSNQDSYLAWMKILIESRCECDLDNHRFKKAALQEDRQACGLFIEYFWLLYEGREREAGLRITTFLKSLLAGTSSRQRGQKSAPQGKIVQSKMAKSGQKGGRPSGQKATRKVNNDVVEDDQPDKEQSVLPTSNIADHTLSSSLKRPVSDNVKCDLLPSRLGESERHEDCVTNTHQSEPPVGPGAFDRDSQPVLQVRESLRPAPMQEIEDTPYPLSVPSQSLPEVISPINGPQITPASGSQPHFKRKRAEQPHRRNVRKKQAPAQAPAPSALQPHVQNTVVKPSSPKSKNRKNGENGTVMACETPQKRRKTTSVDNLVTKNGSDNDAGSHSSVVDATCSLRMSPSDLIAKPSRLDKNFKWETVLTESQIIAALSDWERGNESDEDSSDTSSECGIASVLPEEALGETLTKPPLPEGAKPMIWAATRQSLCESFSWFRAYQSGVYFAHGTAKGYLLSAFSSTRDTFQHGGKLIISHGGGKNVTPNMHGGQKDLIICENQEEGDKSVKYLLNTYDSQLPIVLIADDKFRLFPYELGKHTYIVLGYYWITNAWAEKEPSKNATGFCVKYKFSFQWCDSQGAPWWHGHSKVDAFPPQEFRSANEDDPTQSLQRDVGQSVISKLKKHKPVLVATSSRNEIRNVDSVPDFLQCFFCNGFSPTVYTQGWTCLKPNCQAFWTFSDHTLGTALKYSESFLKLCPAPPSFDRLQDLRPKPPVMTAKDGVTTSKNFTKGWWCSQCGQLNCREKWEHWDCTNCQNTYQVKGRLRSPKEFWEQERNLDFLHHRFHLESGITYELKRWQHVKWSGQVMTYTLPHECGRIHLILGNPMVNKTADELFSLYQEEALSRPFFRRYPLATHTLRGRMLTGYFSQNSGAPYKYVAGTNQTVPFDEAPSAVTRARDLIKERASIVTGKNIDFNEVLSAAYMERQKMSFHSDSEPGLGPVVASLSLGSIALMHFRFLAKSIYAPQTRRRDLTLVLRHGDVLVMEGARIQTEYEHTVIPKNFRIAATARFISPLGAVLPQISDR